TPQTWTRHKPSGGSSNRAQAPRACLKQPLCSWRPVAAAAGFLVAAVLGLVVIIQFARSQLPSVAAPSAEQAPKASSYIPERCGTRVEFVRSPAEAAQRAHSDQKLVFLLHVSGNFEESRFT